MKRIILVRHATAVAHAPDSDDFSRRLRKRGRREAAAMVAWYRDSVGDPPDRMVSSPADRAIETARIFAKGLGYPAGKIVRDKTIYESTDMSDFMEIIKALDDKDASVMLFGHDPAFSDFAHYLVNGFEGVLTKCSVFGIGVNRRHWRTVRSGDGELAFFEHPEGLGERDAALKALRKEMSTRIENGIRGALDGYALGGEEGEKAIRQASKRLARSLAPRAQNPEAEREKGTES